MPCAYMQRGTFALHAYSHASPLWCILLTLSASVLAFMTLLLFGVCAHMLHPLAIDVPDQRTGLKYRISAVNATHT